MSEEIEVSAAQKSKDAEKQRTTALLQNIARLGGKGMKEEDIVYKGNKLTLPERWAGDLSSAIKYLQTKRKEEEEVSTFSRSYNYRPWDGAFNAFQAMKKAFGMVSGKTIHTFFGDITPRYINIPTGVETSEEVPWGQFTVPLLENTVFNFGSSSSADYGLIFQLHIEAPRKHRFIIEGLFKLVEEELKENSIYRGKAIDGQQEPQFIDLRGFDLNKVVYSEQVTSDLEAHLLSVLRYASANKKLGLPLKRSILLTGPYGTGKTLAGFRTAVEAEQAGWTFLMARPGRDDFVQVMQTARLYQPAVVFMEDADTVAAADNEDMISKLLDVFDGLQSKTTDLMVVMTTNHPDLLHKGMMRPGRLDAIIEIGALDGNGIERLIRSVIDPSKLEQGIDFEAVADACAGYMPAFVKEAADRAVRYALVRSGGDVENYTIGTDDLVHAAGGLRSQFQRMQDAPEFSTDDNLGKAFRSIVREAGEETVAHLATDAPEAYDEVWDRAKLGDVQKRLAAASKG